MPEKKINSKNHTARIGESFCRELGLIQKARIESGVDKTKRSFRQLTDLLVRHDVWDRIKRDMINFSAVEVRAV